MRAALIILGMWSLLNILFVVVMIPPRKSRKHSAPSATMAPATINKNAYPFEAEEEKSSLGLILISVGMGACFVLAPLIAEASDGIKNVFRTMASADGASR
jgi:hypothetical protein